MPTQTTNYGLVKPGSNDYYDVGVPDGNMDIIDTELKKAQNHRESTGNPHGTNAADVGASNPNLLINGDFTVWQRGTSFTGATFVYTADRFIGTNLNAAVNVSKLNANGGFKISGATSWAFFTQWVEDFSYLLGKEVTLSTKIKQGTIGFQIDSSDIIGKVSNPTDTSLIVQSKITLPSSATKFGVCFGTTDAVNPTVEIEWIKLEIGSVPTSFSPRLYSEELSDCRRYFQRLNTNVVGYPYIGTVVGYGTQSASLIIPLPVRMRIPPTPTLKGVIWCGVDRPNITNVSADQMADHAMKLGISLDSALAAGIYDAEGHADSNADIWLDSEIY